MKKKYTNINTVLGKILEKHNLGHMYNLENIKRNWASFDKTIAAHAKPLDYDAKYKKLTIRVDNSNWKKEFIANKDLLTIKVQNAFRGIDIKNLEIV
jgi:hypothetical protein